MRHVFPTRLWSHSHRISRLGPTTHISGMVGEGETTCRVRACLRGGQLDGSDQASPNRARILARDAGNAEFKTSGARTR